MTSTEQMDLRNKSIRMLHSGRGIPEDSKMDKFSHLYFILEEDFCLSEKQGGSFLFQIRKTRHKFILKNLQRNFVTFKAPFH